MQGLRIYPNPFGDQFQIILEGESASIEIFDVLGRRVLSQVLENQALISASDWAAGLYYLNIIQGERTINRRVIRQ